VVGIDPDPALDLAPDQSALASFIVDVPPATPPGTSSLFSLEGTIPIEFVSLGLQSMYVGLPIQIDPLSQTGVVPGNSDAMIPVNIQNLGTLPLNGLTWSVFDEDHCFSSVSLLAPPGLPPGIPVPGQIIGELMSDPTLVGRSAPADLRPGRGRAFFRTSIHYLPAIGHCGSADRLGGIGEHTAVSVGHR
jgi:hypothetical protein